MWRVYILAWLAYAVFLSFADQLDKLAQGHFDVNRGAVTFGGLLPSALLLSLAWPLTGILERKQLGPLRILGVHLAFAVMFALLAQGTFWVLFPVNRTLNWYVWPLLYHIMTWLLGAGIFHLIRAADAAHRQALAMKEAQNLVIASELSALRNKLNPHFLFNTLHSIIALTRKNPDAAEAALFQFSDMLRYVLDTEKSGSERVTLDDELRFTRDYLELESLRLGQRLKIEWALDAAAGGHPLPPLSLQPLVENSIKHAFNPHSRPGTLSIRSRIDEGGRRLALSVGDDGPGADPDAVRRSNGLGLRTVERRLHLEYGAQGSLAIDTAPGAGFLVTMSIPLA